MNLRTIALRIAVVGALLVGTFLLLSPQQASACTVSIGYKPSVSVSNLEHPGGGCSTGTSLAGSAAVAVLALGALAAVGWSAFRRGEKATGGPSAGPAGSSPALTAYLNAAGTVPVTSTWGGRHGGQR